MATADSEQLESLLECPICFIKLTDPKVFPCLHIFCQSCIDDLPSTEEDIQSYKCPICRQLTPIANVRPMPFLRDLLEVVDLVKHQPSMCEQCKKENASVRCADCKKNMCGGCRENHDSWMKDHDCNLLGEDKKAIVDKHVYCKKHPKKAVEFNCKDCNELICSLCNGSDHKHHEAETTEDAVQSALPIIKTKQKDLLTKIKVNEETLTNSKARLVEINKEYDDIEKAIHDKKQLMIKKLDEDAKVALQTLADIKNKHVGQMKTVVRGLELEIKSQQNIVAMTNTALTTAKGTSLLQTIQGDVTKSLNSHMDKPTRSSALMTNVRARFSTTPSSMPEASLIGTVTDISGTSPSIATGPSLRALETKNIVLNTDLDLNYNAYRLGVIGADMWLVQWNTNNIHVLSSNGQTIETIEIDGIGTCRSVTQAIDNVAVAATEGMYLVDRAGEKPLKVIAGEMSDVSAHGKHMFTLGNGMSTVHHHKYSTTTMSYVLQTSFKMDDYSRDTYNSIQATQEHVYVAMYNKHCILQYSHAGQLIRTHGSRGSVVGQLIFPWLSDADHEGTILIADENNYRLQTLSRDGTWAAVTLDGLQIPRCARLIGDKLYVLQYFNPRFKIYTVS